MLYFLQTFLETPDFPSPWPGILPGGGFGKMTGGGVGQIAQEGIGGVPP
jgi:hypothetical protein